MTFQEYKTKRAELDAEYINSVLSELDIKGGDIFHIKREICLGQPQYGYTEFDVVACHFTIYNDDNKNISIGCSMYDKDDLVTHDYTIMGEKRMDVVKCCHRLNIDYDKKVGHVDLPADLIKVEFKIRPDL